jgi:hypothetical protein
LIKDWGNIEMSDATFWFGQSTTGGLWYLSSGPSGFTPIDISLLPGSKPDVATMPDSITTQVTGSDFADQSVYYNRVLMNTAAGQTSIDTVRTWNLVKNLQVTSADAQNLYIDGIVHVDAAIGLGTTDDSFLSVNGVKRANVLTGGGDDIVEIGMITYDYSAFSDDFRINTGAGDDIVRLGGLDLNAELAAGDTTYAQFEATGRPLYTSGENQGSFVALGAGNDQFFGYGSNDHIIGGTDTGAVDQTWQNAAPSGFGYAIGGPKTESGGHSILSFLVSLFQELFCPDESILYKIDLDSGQTVAVGHVSIPGKKNASIDVESLALNPTDGFLYGFAVSGSKCLGLVKVDPNTAATTLIGGNIANYKTELNDMSFAKDGSLYFASEGDLLKVSISSGNVTKIANNILSDKIGALAIDPFSDKMYGLSQEGSKTTVTVVDKDAGVVVSKFQISGVPKNAQIEGMSFDSAGNLWAEDRISGSIYEIDLGARSASHVSKTLGTSAQKGDGFEALAIDTRVVKELGDLGTHGGDKILTGDGADHIFYAAGDGVDQIKDFNVFQDVLHVSGYSASQIHIDVLNGDTFIRFVDGSPDGYVDQAMIELSGVTNFHASAISFASAEDYFLL